MTEERNGRVRITIDMEVNEPLMNMIKESMAKMPEMVGQIREKTMGRGQQ